MYIRILLLATLMISLSASAQPSINYHVGWDDVDDHYYRVDMEVGGLGEPTVDVQIPAWRPGRYIIQNYSRYITSFDAVGADGEHLPYKKVDKDTWRVVTRNNPSVTVSYTTYANFLDGGESYLDSTEAYINPISILMNVPGRLREPVGFKVKQPEGWRIATALDPVGAPNEFVAADYHELVDTPFLVSPSFKVVSFEEGGATFDIAIQGNWEFDEDKLVADHRAIAKAQFDIMRTVPFERYLFMYHFPDKRAGHGVEHKNSTSIVLGPASAITQPDDGEQPSGLYGALLRVASHELFHVWLVERIRPAVMYPTDYSTEAYTTQMWIYEGITDYYADLSNMRAGLMTTEAFYDRIGSTVNSFDQNPGRKVTSIAMSSFDSWTKEGKAPPKTWYSFYTAGKAMGLVLDMEVRGRTNGEKSLDDVMRYLYAEYPAKDSGVPEDGFQKALETLTGTSFADFFNNHIYGRMDVDWDAHLANAGLHLMQEPNQDPAAWLQVFLADNTVMGANPAGSGAKAGLKSGDKILAVNEEDAGDDDVLKAAFEKLSPDDTVQLTVERGEEEVDLEITLGRLPVKAYLMGSSKATDAQVAIREAWLGGK